VRPIWKGALTFGLVNIPVGLYSATTRNDLSFRLLHASDLPGDTNLDRREIDLALQLVDTLAGEFDPGKYRDQYRDALLAVIERKLQGQAPVAAAARKPPTKVVDLMQALEASLKTRAGRGAKPSERRGAAAGRREGGGRRAAARRRAS